MLPKLYAEGSKDIYPTVTEGGRAYLRASTSTSVAFPFPNLGTHFVYAEAGEQIAIATNAQSGQTGDDARIRLYHPNGTSISLNITLNNGNISNRSAELAGPRLPGQGNGGNRYLPIYYTVPAGGAGIYKVEFRGTSGNTTGENRYSYSAATSWPSAVSNSTYLIAWDISVAKQTGSSWGWVDGRVYTNVLNMDNPSFNTSNTSEFISNSGFHGKFKVLTRDGYVYNVDNNGSQGLSFTFMVNNRGFHQEGNPNDPSYKSIAAPNAASVQNRYHNPNNADAEAAVTHKIFYNLPDQNMPESTTGGPIGAQETWLKPQEKDLNVEEIKVVGVDGSENKLGSKGAFIEFFNESGGDYYIEISPISGSSTFFPKRLLSGSSKFGENRIYWDGKDGAGEPLPNGLADVNIALKLRGAEVHFPYIDMELNHNGIIIELLNKVTNYTSVISDKVFWNDSDIGNGGGNNGSKTNPRNASHTVLSAGTSSNTNGHIWGINSNNTSGTFGDNHGMDTWTFIEGNSISIDFKVDVRIADLYTEIESYLVNGDSSSFATIDDKITYKVVVGNKGPSDVEDAPFTFRLPSGFVPDEIIIPVFTGNGCGTESVELSYDEVTQTFVSKLNLPNECKITYTFNATVTESSDPDDTEAVAGILRPNDVTDPNATNSSDPSKPTYVLPSGRTWDDLWKYPDDWPHADDVDNYYIPPFSAEFECQYNSGEDCNNIDREKVALHRISDLEIVKSVDKSIPEVGETITFTLKVINHGPHKATGIFVTDTVPSGFSIGTINNGGTVAGNIITWNISDLLKGDSTLVSFEAMVLSSGSYVNIATVTGKGEDPNPDNNTDTATASPKNNYWIGGKSGAPNDWDKVENWTGGYVPDPGEDIEFATEVNNPTVSGNLMSGPAKDNLYLGDGTAVFDRVIGDLINDSDKDLWVTIGDQLTINGIVKDENSDNGTIVVKADPEDEKPSGTLIFTNPDNNQNVDAVVEFYNRAYDCADCGFYTSSWQYFGIPVKESNFPNDHVEGNETVNQWVEPFNGNKWQAAPYAPDSNLKAFKGYQITNDEKTQPTDVYSFTGTLHVGDASVVITRTDNVNYTGANLVGNSYTAAIPISDDAMLFPIGVQQTVYLFNTGTRDEWRKLNGTAINQAGYRSGQYLAVPVNHGGTPHFPDRIPSMHAFMVFAESGT
ncbi:MAG: DUF11 domain-containing protein, partial [Bacteroidales bacterium]|nr:DUF11 domain-containing protein [Bacteroidales bacterium]